MTTRLLAVLAALLLAPGIGRAQGATFFDGDFAPENWAFLEFETNEGGTASGEVIASGNPGPALRVTLVKNAAPGFSQIAGIWFWHELYDPAVSGAFASVDYAETARMLQGSGNGHGTGVALRQNDSIFLYRAGFTPEFEWTPKRASGVVPTDFSRLTGGGTLDFSDTGAPIEVGFYRADSHGASGGSSGTRVVDIDNWHVSLVPPCELDADCDDADACTTDVCDEGICRRTPLDCDDGDACTIDACVDGECDNVARDCDDGRDCTLDACVAGGSCTNVPFADLTLVQQKIDELLAILEGAACGEELLQRQVVKKLVKRLKKARKKVAKADTIAKVLRIPKLVTKAALLLDQAELFLDRLVDREKLSPECGAALGAFIDELQECLGGVPLP